MSKEKLNELLGIKDDQDIDSFLDDLSTQTNEISTTFSHIDDNVKASIQQIDNNLSAIQTNSCDTSLALKNMDLSMKEIEDMIELSKKLFKHIYNNIITSDLLDSELIESAAKMLESIHINIAEFLEMYREKQRFIEKIKLMIFQQEQRKELMLLKHKYDMEKIQAKAEPVDVEAENAVPYCIEDIVRLMHTEELKEEESQEIQTLSNEVNT